jgi:glycosyltransferase involved in cell wall biosynthesis
VPLFGIEILASLLSDKVVCASQRSSTYIPKFIRNKSKFSVIQSGVDIDRFHPSSKEELRDQFGIAQDRKVVLYVGRADENKRPEVLVRALQHLPNDYLLFMVFPQKEESVVHFFRENHQIDLNKNNIVCKFLAPDEEMPLYYRTADVFALVSKSESSPLTMVEAVASGLPIITAPNAFHELAFKHMYNGLLVEDVSAEAIAGAIKKVFESLVQYSNNSKQLMIENELAWKFSIASYLKLVKEVMLSSE